MRSKTARKIILLVIAAAFIASTAILIIQRVQSKRPRTGDVMFKMPANGSSGEHYEYAFDRDDILREVDRYSKSVPIVFQASVDVWEFDIIGEGELTVSWTAYQGGSDIVKDECFAETYRVEDGKCRKTFDSRKDH